MFKQNYKYKVSELLNILSPSSFQLFDREAGIQYLAYDTRRIYKPESSLFFAFEANRDGHEFIRDAYFLGVRNFVIQKNFTEFLLAFPDANWILVDSTWSAFEKLVTFHRNQLSFPIIGITGSNGKTTVKEWLYFLLSQEFKVGKTPKSYNSKLGVGLSLWDLNTDLDYAIIETGISEKGEMEHIEALVKPKFGIFTNIGGAHQSGFASLEEKIIEKSKLFESVEKWIINQSVLDELDNDDVLPKNYISWQILQTQRNAEGGSHISIQFDKYIASFDIPFLDRASIENACSVYVFLFLIGYDEKLLIERIRILNTLEMRMELKKGAKDRSIIDDSYSNDLHALRIALQFLNQQKQHEIKCLILSDFPLETIGDNEEDINNAYLELKKLIESASIDVLLTVGKETFIRKEELGVEQHFVFSDTDELLKNLEEYLPEKSCVLIKGARKYGFERIGKKLSYQSHQTTLEVNLKALEYNIRKIRKELRPGVQIMAMVKAFSYGSGSYEIANLLQFQQVDYLTVAYVDEGVELRQAGIDLPIVVMNPEYSGFELMISYDLEPEIFDWNILYQWIDFCESQHILHSPIHIKIDTGMHRLGFCPTEILKLAEFITQNPLLNVVSVFSHFVGSGNPELDDFSAKQLEEFRRAADIFINKIGYAVKKHMANSEAIFRFPNAQLDMVRVGIGMYGIYGQNKGLKSVLKLKSHITQIKQVKAGESVGYGRKAILEKDTTVATIRIGYADGYDRRFGNGKGKMLINGEYFPTLGDICMDMCMVDITGQKFSAGEEVVVIEDFQAAAKSIDTIPYELLVNISPRVKRSYYYS